MRGILDDLDAREFATAIGAGRIGLGCVAGALPVGTVRALGSDSATARRVAWLTRMTAARDAVLGAGTLVAARRGRDVTPWLLAGAVCDAVDALAVAGALRQRRVRGVIPTLTVPFAAAAAGVSAATAIRLRRR